MLGIELRIWKRWTIRLSAPRNLFSPGSGLTLQDSPLALFHMGPFARDGLSLACNGSRLLRLHSRVNPPGLPLRSLRPLLPLPVRPYAPLPGLSRLAPG